MIKDFIRKYFLHRDEFHALHARLNQIDEQQRKLEKIVTLSKEKAAACEYLIQLFMGHWQLETMSRYGEVSAYKLVKHIARLHELMQVRSPKSEQWKLCRVGKGDDGGYVMLDKFEGSKIAYSFGICDDVSWDKLMAEQGYDIYMYDHTIGALPEENEKFHWQQIGLCGIYDQAHPELRTLPMLLEDNGHLGEKHMILKMDIEGAEWECFANLDNKYMEQFDQIVLELHNMNDMSRSELMEKALNRLNASHQLVHIHGNNCVPYQMAEGMVMPGVIECTYIKKDVCEFVDEARIFPDELDCANNALWPDIYLGKWN